MDSPGLLRRPQVFELPIELRSIEDEPEGSNLQVDSPGFEPGASSMPWKHHSSLSTLFRFGTAFWKGVLDHEPLNIIHLLVSWGLQRPFFDESKAFSGSD